MAGIAETKARVVDLLKFKAEHGQRQLDFASHRPAQPRLGIVEPFRPLSARQIAHRQRMQAFLSAGSTS